MTRLPSCPKWCVTDHSEDLQDELCDIVVHSSEPSRVPIDGEEGTDHEYRYAYACASQADGEAPTVFVSAGGVDLTPDNAMCLAAGILKAANIASGGALDRMLFEGKSMRPWHHWGQHPRGGVA